MDNILSVPHYQQSDEGFCLPACARMILAYFGHEREEADVGRILGARKYGTPSSAIERLNDSEIEVIYQPWSAVELFSMFEAGNPAIVFVRTIFLDYCQEDYAHALVVVGGSPDQQFWIQDPARQAGPISVSWDGVLAAWSEFDYHGAVVRLR